MNTDNVIEMIEVGIEYLLITVFLVVVLNCISIRNNFAETINKNYDLQADTVTRLEFSKFDTGANQNDINQCVTADILLETLRKYKDGSIRVYVNKVKNNVSLNLDSTTAITQKELFTQESLITMIDFSKYYHPYLVYDAQSMTGPYTNEGIEVSGIAFLLYEN